ncbi:hypothetical protein [Rhizobium leguminosarum]|uniref:hypothetical protein n=1 Tax=Rhizobium leguminosarum TaxID=384 RepID=UPI0028AE6571|nr:hypothetical protein [Rhizobium leguminosarum]
MKIAIIEAFREAGISRTELARRMGKNEKEARRLLDDPDVSTKLPLLVGALAAKPMTTGLMLQLN